MLDVVQGANLALRFVLELCALAALSFWGWRTGSATWSQVLLAVGAPLAAGVMWGAFAAPRSAVAVSGAVRFGIQALVLGGAALALVGVRRPTLAAVFAAAVLVNGALIAVWDQ